MAPLLPTLREKKRYLIYEVVADTPLTRKDVEKAIQDALQQFLGDLGRAKAGVMFLKDWKNNRGICKVSHKEVDHVKAALTLVHTVNGKKALIRSVGLSGILDKARSKYLN